MKRKEIVGWSAQIIMAILFLIACSWKIISHPIAVQNFENWGYPVGFYMVIGLLELVGGLLLLHTRTAGYACIILFSVMIGAVITHIVHAEWLILLKPISHMAGLLVIFYIRFIQEIGNDEMENLPLNKFA